MRYVIAGVDVAEGVCGDDVSQARPYFELGWELVTTHFEAKRLKKEGRLSAALDTVVTCRGREFLYSTEFARVIPYGQYLVERTGAEDELRLVDRYADGKISAEYFDVVPHSPEARYRYLEEDRAIIASIATVDVTELHNGEPFGCVAVRRRDHGAYRNVGDEAARAIVGWLSTRYRRVFLVGHGSEHLSTPPAVQHVTLQTFASLIRSRRCEWIVGSFTGPMHLASLYANGATCLVLNYDAYDAIALNHPVLLGRCVTLSSSRFLYLHPAQLEWFLAAYRP
jgi:hypothetical protein